MAFFVKFPALQYDLDIATGKKLANPRIVTDIFKRIIIKRNLQEAATVFTKYIVKDEDTAEIIAHKLYGSAGLHWLVYLPNEIINPFFDWPLSERKLVPFIEKKYPGSTFFLDPAQINGDGFLEGVAVSTTSGAIGTVTKVDTTLSSLVVENILGVFQEGDTLIQDVGTLVPVTATLTRLVARSKDALNHFEDEQGNYLNPVSFRNGYIQGGFGFPPTVNVITNDGYERDQNESKRQIRLIDPAHIDVMLRDLETIFRSNAKKRTL